MEKGRTASQTQPSLTLRTKRNSKRNSKKVYLSFKYFYLFVSLILRNACGINIWLLDPG